MKRTLTSVGIGTSFFAAGVIIGLGFIAAGVKFTAQRPEILDLLDVGRVQFGALHAIELWLVPLACFAMLAGTPKLWKAILLSLGCFLFKVLYIQPPLHARMIARLSGEPVLGTGPHEYYVYVAGCLTLLLVIQGALAIRALGQPAPVEAPDQAVSVGIRQPATDAHR